MSEKSEKQVSEFIDSIRSDDYLKAKDDLQKVVDVKLAKKIADKGVEVLQRDFKGTDIPSTEE
jgi:hypothetical protein